MIKNNEKHSWRIKIMFVYLKFYKVNNVQKVSNKYGSGSSIINQVPLKY